MRRLTYAGMADVYSMAGERSELMMVDVYSMTSELSELMMGDGRRNT